MSEQAAELIRQGREYGTRGDARNALACFNKAIQIEPENSQAYYYRGIAYLKLFDDPVRAVSDLNAALRLRPDVIELYLWRGRAYQRLNENTKASADLERFLRAKPNHPEAADIRGFLLEQAMQTPSIDVDELRKRAEALAVQSTPESMAQAIDLFTQMINAQPMNADAYDDRGVCFMFIEQYDQAIADFNQAIRLKPDSGEYYSSRGHTYNRMGDNERALKDADKAIQLEPEKPMAYALRSKIWGQKQDYKKALADVTTAIHLGYGIARYQRAYLIQGMKKKSPEEAWIMKSDFEYLLRIAPGASDSIIMLGEIEEVRRSQNEKKWTSEAEKLINKAVKVATQKQTMEAIELFSKVLDLFSLQAGTYFDRASLYVSLKQPERALVDFDDAILASPGYIDAYVNRGMIYAKSGRKDLAAENFNHALSLCPDEKSRILVQMVAMKFLES